LRVSVARRTKRKETATDNHPRAQGLQSDHRTATFTGAVWGDPVMLTADDVTINNVFFAPGERTHWLSHDWHGTAAGRFMSQTAISLGKTRWHSAVEAHEYPPA